MIFHSESHKTKIKFPKECIMSFGNPFSNYEDDSGAQGLGHNGFEVSLNYVSGIPDPNIVSNSTLKLIFKSLLKRDEVTKEKALNELSNFVNKENLGVLKDDLVIITWIQLYPKLSISESKSVRLLSHQVQIAFISTLQKYYVKYLKDSIPVLLTGLYDFDSSVVNSTIKHLNSAFNNDVTKVNNLWFFFQSEILNFVDQVLNKETVDSLSDDRFVARDEAELKYLRLVNATISLIAHLIQLANNKNELSKLDKSIVELQRVFSYENLWHYLLINTNINNQRIFKTLLSLIAAVSKINQDLFTDKAWKLLSKRFIKSLTFAKKIDSSSNAPSSYSSLILPIINTLNILKETNPNFYQHDKSHKERIIDFLRIGSLDCSPTYYSYLSQFLKTSHILNLKQDSELVEKILLNDFEIEVRRNLKFRQGADIIVASLTTLLEITHEVEDSDYFKVVLDKALDITSPIASRFVDPISQYVPSSIITAKLIELPSSNFGLVLKIALKSSVSLEEPLSVSFNDLREKAEEDEEGETFKSHPAFEILDFVIKNDLVQYASLVYELIDELPSFITRSVIEKPIGILINLSKSKLYKKELFIETFDSFIIKLDLLNAKESLISKLDSFANKTELLSCSGELQAAVSDAFANYKFESDELFKAHLITSDSLVQLYELAKAHDKVGTFIDYYLKYNLENDELLEHLVTSTNILTDIWSQPNEQLHSKLESFILNDKDIKARYFQSLKNYILNNGASHEITSLISKLLESNSSFSSDVFNDSFFEELNRSYGETIDSRLSLGNPLESNIYLLPTEEKSFEFKKLVPILRYGLFLNSLSFEWGLEVIVYLAILSEIGNDYEFLVVGEIPFDVDALFGFKQSIDKKLLEFNNNSYAEIISGIISNSPVNDLIETLLHETNRVLAFYKIRLLKFILANLPSTITGLDIESYTKQEIRSKDPLEVLRFVTAISTLSEFLSDSKFERTKNMIASELIGLRPSEILNVGLTKLIILNNYIANETEFPFQPQRFSMIINDILKWLDSDIAYEADFQVLRIELLQFITCLLSLEFDRNDNFKELTSRLLQDSTGLITIGEGDHLLELKYHTLRLFLVLKKKKSELEKEMLEDAENEILESYFRDDDVETNQAVVVYNQLLNRFIQNLDITKLKDNYEILLKKYQRSRFAGKRTLLSILEKLIILQQQDLVIEYELNNDKEDLSTYKIPQIFIDDILHAFEFNDDDEDDQRLVNYLWDWRLVLLHFKDITLNLRSLYIQQLQNENDELITKFLNLVTLIIIDINDKAFLSSLGNDQEQFINYDFNTDHPTTEEVRFLSIHLFYTVLVSVGSLGANWFHNIKDRGFKAKIETFTSKYISPSLIRNKLDAFNNKISNFTKDDDNLTIKINKITNEIKSTYLIDEQYLEIIFKIPSNFPLSNIEVLGPQRVGVKENQWKAWLLASQRIVSLQNGEISESLEFFLKNVKFHFKGFEECAICYSILHQDNSLPSKTCSTCKNKFHSGCLYKWFKSSGGSTCPLCRATFNFR